MAGPPIQTLVDPVSKTELQQAVADLLDVWWLPMLDDATKLAHDGYRAYAILTMCRMLYTGQTGQVVSKPAAARWALQTQATRWHALIKAAQQWQGNALDVQVAAAQAFIQFTSQSIAPEKGESDRR